MNENNFSKLNPLIIEKINSLDIEKNMKNFLKETLLFELNQLQQAEIRFKENYLKRVDFYYKG